MKIEKPEDPAGSGGGQSRRPGRFPLLIEFFWNRAETGLVSRRLREKKQNAQ